MQSKSDKETLRVNSKSDKETLLSRLTRRSREERSEYRLEILEAGDDLPPLCLPSGGWDDARRRAAAIVRSKIDRLTRHPKGHHALQVPSRRNL